MVERNAFDAWCDSARAATSLSSATGATPKALSASSLAAVDRNGPLLDSASVSRMDHDGDAVCCFGVDSLARTPDSFWEPTPENLLVHIAKMSGRLFTSSLQELQSWACELSVSSQKRKEKSCCVRG